MVHLKRGDKVIVTHNGLEIDRAEVSDVDRVNDLVFAATFQSGKAGTFHLRFDCTRGWALLKSDGWVARGPDGSFYHLDVIQAGKLVPAHALVDG